MTSSPTLSSVQMASRSPRTLRVGLRTAAARLSGLWLSLGLMALFITPVGCGTVGKGPDPAAVVDMSRAGDLAPAPLCSPVNCAGCCLGDVCQPGVTAAACGGSGAVCVQCANAQKCGADLVCAFDPNATWLVASVKATIMTTNPLNGGKMWRADGTMPQPLVQYDAINRISASAIVVSGSPPVWTVTWGMGFNYAAKDLLSTGFDLQVLDQLTATTTQPMSNKHHVTLSQQDFASKNLTYTGWEGVTSLSITLQ